MFSWIADKFRNSNKKLLALSISVLIVLIVGTTLIATHWTQIMHGMAGGRLYTREQIEQSQREAYANGARGREVALEQLSINQALLIELNAQLTLLQNQSNLDTTQIAQLLEQVAVLTARNLELMQIIYDNMFNNLLVVSFMNGNEYHERQLVEPNTPIVLPILNPTRAGYIFIGWHVGGSIVDLSGHIVTGHSEFRAAFRSNNTTQTFTTTHHRYGPGILRYGNMDFISLTGTLTRPGNSSMEQFHFNYNFRFWVFPNTAAGRADLESWSDNWWGHGVLGTSLQFEVRIFRDRIEHFANGNLVATEQNWGFNFPHLIFFNSGSTPNVVERHFVFDRYFS